MFVQNLSGESSMLHDQLMDALGDPKYAYPNVAVWKFSYYKKQENSLSSLPFNVFRIEIILIGNDDECYIGSKNNFLVKKYEKYKTNELLGKDIFDEMKKVVEKNKITITLTSTHNSPTSIGWTRSGWTPVTGSVFNF